jgi:spore germination protein GerM
MKHFFIYLIAFLIIIALAIFNLGLISGHNFWFTVNSRSGKSVDSYVLPGDQCAAPKAGNEALIGTTTPPSADGVATEIQIDTPESNTVITSPLVISGQAKGTWFFEGSFPIKLIGENGKVIAQGIASAQSEWMTDNLVPFKAQLKYSAGTSTIGMLVFTNDNPSGLPENEKEFGVPVRFRAIEQVPVKVYFNNDDLNKDKNNCWQVFPVQRLVDKTSAPARSSLEQLLLGLTEAETNQGYLTSINQGVKINSLTLDKQGTAKVDFNQQIQDQVGGSCRVSSIRAQITQTLEQFTSVKRVIISVEGNTQEALQP